MTRAAWMSACISIISVIAAFTSISSIVNPFWRFMAVFVCLCGLGIGIMGCIALSLNIFTAWHTLSACKKLGIHRIYTHSHLCSEMPIHIENAKEIRIMAVTALAWLRAYEDQIRRALAFNGVHIRLLISAPESDFLKNVENIESDTRSGHGTAEILQVDDLLREFIQSAQEIAGPNRSIGKISRAYYRTELRNSIVLCDDSWGWLTINLPPRRARQMPSLELTKGSEALLEDCINHFEKVWKFCDRDSQVQVIME